MVSDNLKISNVFVTNSEQSHAMQQTASIAMNQVREWHMHVSVLGLLNSYVWHC